LKKNEQWSFSSGYIPPAILNFVVAYDGPQQMDTVLGWIIDIENKLGITGNDLPLGEQRISVPSESIDGVFLLDRGFVTFDNFPIGFLDDEDRQKTPKNKWVAVTAQRGSLLWLFQMLTQASMNINGTFLNLNPYMKNLRVALRTG
ncbi:hypothetical protein OSK35_26905, partial [Escherichia coli]|nr:hypothetical protein [Escherichia coli]